MNKFKALHLMLAALTTVGLLLSGCAQPAHKPATAMKSQAQRPPVVTLNTKPDWLLIGGVDVDKSVGGDRVNTNNLTLLGYEVRAYGNDQVKITFVGGGKIIYWSGKGEITNVNKGERVLVPLTAKK